MHIKFLGCCNEVGRSAILVTCGKRKVLMDAGLGFEDRERHALPSLNEKEIKEIGAVVVSHAHLDHSGFLPYLIKKGFRGKIYVTKPTRDIMHLLLSDAVNVMQMKGEKLYGHEDVRRTMEMVEVLEFKEEKEILKGIRLKFYASSHILGSAQTLLKCNGKNILYTSDLNTKETKLMNGAEIPIEKIDALIIESTYGGKNDRIPNVKTSSKLLADEVKETIAHGGKILIPVFAVGRGQEIMLALESYIRSGYLPEIHIYVDGMVGRANKIYRHNVIYMKEEIPKRILLADDDPFKSKYVHVPQTKTREDVFDKKDVVILATSGMMTGGPVLRYLGRIAGEEKNKIIFVGYQAEGTKGREILDGKREIKIFDEKGEEKNIQIRCKIKQISFSAHSDSNDLLQFIRKLNKAKNVYIIHGEEEKIREFKEIVEKKAKRKAVAPKLGEEFVI